MPPSPPAASGRLSRATSRTVLQPPPAAATTLQKSRPERNPAQGALRGPDGHGGQNRPHKDNFFPADPKKNGKKF